MPFQEENGLNIKMEITDDQFRSEEAEQSKILIRADIGDHTLFLRHYLNDVQYTAWYFVDDMDESDCITRYSLEVFPAFESDNAHAMALKTFTYFYERYSFLYFAPIQQMWKGGADRDLIQIK